MVEDAPILREVYAECLEAAGFSVSRAENGEEAMRQVKQLRPSTVVLDLLMPRLDGLDTLREIKAFDPSIRVVIVTGTVNQEIRAQAEAYGANGFLNKPIQPEALVATVKGLR